LIYLQVFRANDFTDIASGTRKNIVTLKARRGDIVDSKGNLMATTRSVVDIGIDPQSIKVGDNDKLLKLSKILSLETQVIESAVRKKIKKGDEFKGEFKKVRWVKLKESVSEEIYNKVRELGITGVYGNYKHSRLYPGNKLASHLLGFVNKEGIAVMGTEKFADYYLKGQDGWKVSEKDGKRREMPQFRSLEVAPSDGLNVELSIDWFIQDMVEKELARIVDEYAPVGASMIVSQPATGAILAMANVPDFDPNLFNKYEIRSHRNRALTDLYELISYLLNKLGSKSGTFAIANIAPVAG
jgi:cell division protein FtsI (penicillin-binding protein 3)/stage V sporulation protein D (sporulation-specific penicillin-binding protein)